MPRNQSLIKNDNIAADQKAPTWIPLAEIAKGDVGVVFKVRDLEGKILAAMKVEIIRKGLKKKHIEMEILDCLRDSPHSLHLIYHSYSNQTRITVMTLAGPTLGVIKNLMKNKFSDSTILRLAIRTLLTLKDLHEHGYIHRDLEPENIALSYCKSSRSVFLLDFGEARQYARMDNGKWILRAPRKQIQFRGSNQYCSLKMHNNEEIGRIDDIWSWLYIFIEMRVFLPWTDSTFQCKYAPRKKTLLDETLDSDPFLAIFHPIVKIMTATSKYEDRPEYFKIYEILADKMKQMGVKWEDPMDYDQVTERQTFFSTTPMNEEKMTEEQVAAVFQEVVVPGGSQYVLPANVPFYPEKEKEKEKTVKSEKKKAEPEKEKTKDKDDKEKEKEKEPEKKKVVEKPKEKEKAKPKDNKKSKEVIAKDRKLGSQEKTADKSSDAPSKNLVEKTSKQPKTVTPKPVLLKKGTKTSSTSSVSHQTPPSVEGKPPSSLPVPTPTRPPMRKKPAMTPGNNKVKT